MFRWLSSLVPNFFGKKKSSAKEFGQCIFISLKKQVVDEGPVKEDLDSIERLLAADIADAELEKFLIPLYLRIEQYISSAQSRNRLSANELRGYIYQRCVSDQAWGDMPLLFLPIYLQRIRIFEKYIEILIKKSGNNLDTGIVQQYFNESQFVSGVFKNGEFDWIGFENLLVKESKEPEAQEMRAEEVLKQISSKIFSLLAGKLELIRTELIFREAYQQLRSQIQFVEDVPQVMRIIPDQIMKEERVEILSKPKLIDELRKRNQELEFTLSQLSEEKRKLEAEREKLASTLESLQKADRAKSDFITVVSHQFRTPLSAIRWNDEILMDELAKANLGDKQEEFLGYARAIYGKIIFIINILEDIYDVLAIEGKTVTIDAKPSQLWEIISESVRLLDSEAQGKKVQVEFDKNGVPLKEVLIDQQKIKRVCMILLRNAIRYSSENGKVRILVREALLDGRPAVSCSIQDFGIGIAQEDMKNIFTKFFRAKNAVQVSPDGAGLGLYLVKNFIEAHRGIIQVESALGQGATFTFVILQP